MRTCPTIVEHNLLVALTMDLSHLYLDRAHQRALNNHGIYTILDLCSLSIYRVRRIARRELIEESELVDAVEAALETNGLRLSYQPSYFVLELLAA